MTTIDTVVGELVSETPVVGKVVSLVYTGARMTGDIISIAMDPTNETLDRIESLIDNGNTLDALQLNTSVVFDSNGNYQINYMSVNINDLKNAMEAYNYYEDANLTMTVDQVVASLKDGTITENAQLMDYIQWYERDNGDIQTARYLENVKNP